LSQNWYAVGRYNYSLQKEPNLVTGAQRGLVESLAGLEYDGGCWVARAVLQRFATGADQANNAVFFQIELNGIARVGTDPLDALRRSIPNYRMINRLSPMPAKFDNFQ
jgi:LPS-assembly protein